MHFNKKDLANLLKFPPQTIGADRKERWQSPRFIALKFSNPINLITDTKIVLMRLIVLKFRAPLDQSNFKMVGIYRNQTKIGRLKTEGIAA